MVVFFPNVTKITPMFLTIPYRHKQLLRQDVTDQRLPEDRDRGDGIRIALPVPGHDVVL